MERQDNNEILKFLVYECSNYLKDCLYYYLWDRSYIMSFYWNSGNCISITQDSFGSYIGVTKINCCKTLQSYPTEGILDQGGRLSWKHTCG